jgi:hypothetical protein
MNIPPADATIAGAQYGIQQDVRAGMAVSYPGRGG